MTQNTLERYIQIFDDYLDGTLDSVNEADLKTALEENPTLRDQLEEHIRARTNIRIAGEQQLKEKFKQRFITEKEESPADNNPKPIKRRNWIWIALLAIVGILAAWYTLSTQDDTPIEQPRLLVNLEDPSYDLLRSESDDAIRDQWQRAVQEFIRKNYIEALQIIDAMNQNEEFLRKHSGKFFLMKGVSNLKLENYELASSSLSQIEKNNPYYDQAEWYLAMTAYFGQQKEAKSRLQSISQSNHYKSEEAKHYLEMINK